MYKAFFGLHVSPFELSPDPFFMVSSEKSKEALASISGAVGRRKGFVVMTGEVGTGKTLILRCLFELWEREQIPFAYFIGPRLSTTDFLSYINFELGITVEEPTKGNLLRALYGFLLAQFEKGLTTVLVIDEAHQIPRSVLEEIRLLTNFETSQQKLIQIVLAGQPELDKKLDSPELRSLKQRIAVRCTLEPLRADEIRNYIERRLVLAGADVQVATIFPAETVKAIYCYSQGIQRLVNNICDQALVAACAQHLRVVPIGVIDEVASRFRLEPTPGLKQTERPFSPASKMECSATDNSGQVLPVLGASTVEAPDPDDVSRYLDKGKGAPTQRAPRTQPETAPKNSPSDDSTRYELELKQKTIERDEIHDPMHVPRQAATEVFEARPLQPTKVSALASGAFFLADCHRVIDQAMTSVGDLRAIDQANELVGDMWPLITTKHASPNAAQVRLDPIAALKSEASVPPTGSPKAQPGPAPPLDLPDASVTPSPQGLSKTAVSIDPEEIPAKHPTPEPDEKPVTPAAIQPPGPEAKLVSAIQASGPEAKLVPAIQASEPEAKLVPAIRASGLEAKPLKSAAIRSTSLSTSTEVSKVGSALPQEELSPPLAFAAAANSTHPVAAPQTVSKPVAPDSSTNLSELSDAEVLSGYIAALRANHNAEYFEKQKVAALPAAQLADPPTPSELPSGDAQPSEKTIEPGQAFTSISKGVLISAVAGLLALGAATARYLERPSNPVQDAAKAAVTHASTTSGASRSLSQNSAAGPRTPRGNTTRGASKLASDLFAYTQLAEPSPAPKKTIPGQARLAGPTMIRRDRTPNANDAGPAPLIDGRVETNANGLSGGLADTGQLLAPPTALPTGGQVKQARLLSSVSPLYPPLAKNVHVAGDVRIDALVGATGHVSTMKVVSGPALLRQAAVDALGQWKYEPATVDGKPVPMHLMVTIQFRY
jgi:general secretion pathway protein A